MVAAPMAMQAAPMGAMRQTTTVVTRTPAYGMARGQLRTDPVPVARADPRARRRAAALGGELKQQFKLRMQLSTGQLNESHLVKATRRNIARIKTAMAQKAGE